MAFTYRGMGHTFHEDIRRMFRNCLMNCRDAFHAVLCLYCCVTDKTQPSMKRTHRQRRRGNRSTLNFHPNTTVGKNPYSLLILQFIAQQSKLYYVLVWNAPKFNLMTILFKNFPGQTYSQTPNFSIFRCLWYQLMGVPIINPLGIPQLYILAVCTN